jgi:hypothetical protein
MMNGNRSEESGETIPAAAARRPGGGERGPGRRAWLIARWIGLALAGPWAATASADVLTCGSTVGPGKKVVLEGSVTGCRPDLPAITVIGPVTLDLNGQTVSCATDGTIGQRPFGIQVIGERARIKNGRVVDCLVGVALQGEGGHSLSEMSIERPVVEGVYAGGDRNRISDVTVTSSYMGVGISVDGARNTLTRCTSNGNYREGFRIWGEGNRVSRGVASDNGSRGFEVRGDRVRLSGNVALYTRDPGATGDGDGIVIFGISPVLTGNTASFNVGRGFDVIANLARITSNSASGNGREGFIASGTANVLQRNSARTNRGAGIRLRSGAEETRVLANTALGNDPAALDLRDDSAGCGTNRWGANVFETASSCIE